MEKKTKNLKHEGGDVVLLPSVGELHEHKKTSHILPAQEGHQMYVIMFNHVFAEAI